MNKKINTLFFILIFIFLISAVSAANNENETVTSIEKTDQDLCKISVENENTEKLESAKNDEILSASQNTKVVKKKTTLTAPNVKMYYKDGTKFTAALKYGKKSIQNAKIQIKINGQTFTRTTDSNGKVYLNINYNSGTYSVLSTCLGNSEFEGSTAKSTVTIKSTVKCSDLTKFYKNTAAYYSTFYDKNGKLLKNTAVKFKVNTKTYSVKTNALGVAKLNINLNPGKYSINSINSKTSEIITKTITIKSLIETKDLTMTHGDGSKFNVKILNSYGKASPNKKVILKINGKSFTKITDKNGIATLPISMEVGKYTITTEYDGLKATNKITINKFIKHSEFIHSFKIPNYVNVTMPYVFHNSIYSLKTGCDGIIKLPKNQYIVMEIGSKIYKFTTTQISGYDATNIGYKSYLIPFDNSGVKNDLNKNNLKGNGILIYNSGNYIQIDYRDTTSDNIELFGMYADKGLDGFETITYTKNDIVTAKVSFKTLSFDEMGLKYSLSKFYGKTIYDINYNNIDENSVKFANTKQPVTFSMFGSYVVGYISKEDIITKFIIDGKEELEKQETISYGLCEKYRKNYGFEVLQTFTIINEKITQKTLETWINSNSKYISKFGLMNLYGMHLSSLQTTWLADEIADRYAKDFNLNWKRGNTVTILGGINLEDTYLHILNADMGMDVKGTNASNVKLFRLMNSIILPKIEDYSMKKIAARYLDNTTNSLDNIINAIKSDSFSVAQLGEMFYIMCEDGTNSTIVLNSTNGVASVLVGDNTFSYKGSSIKTACDCCSVLTSPKDIITGLRDSLSQFSKNANNFLNNIFRNIQPIITVGTSIASTSLGLASKVTTGPMITLSLLISPMISIQAIGNKIKNEMIPKNDWHYAYDRFTFTRGGYLQGKKIYNIPNNKGGYDYVEVSVNKDNTLDRNNALYISNGNTRKLTKQETYSYFDDEYWSPINIPTKYWDESWKGVIK